MFSVFELRSLVVQEVKTHRSRQEVMTNDGRVVGRRGGGCE